MNKPADNRERDPLTNLKQTSDKSPDELQKEAVRIARASKVFLA